jgi:hypothetical protein
VVFVSHDPLLALRFFFKDVERYISYYTGPGRDLKEKKPMSSGWSLDFGVVEGDPGRVTR